MTDKTIRTIGARNPDEVAIRELFGLLLDDWGRGRRRGLRLPVHRRCRVRRLRRDAYQGAPGDRRLTPTALRQVPQGHAPDGPRLSMKFVRPDVALIHATGGTVMRDKTKPSPERDSIQTLVAVREGAEWRFAAFHNSRVRPIGSNAATFLLWAFTDRLWRIFAPGKEGA